MMHMYEDSRLSPDIAPVADLSFLQPGLDVAINPAATLSLIILPCGPVSIGMRIQCYESAAFLL